MPHIAGVDVVPFSAAMGILTEGFDPSSTAALRSTPTGWQIRFDDENRG